MLVIKCFGELTVVFVVHFDSLSLFYLNSLEHKTYEEHKCRESYSKVLFTELQSNM